MRLHEILSESVNVTAKDCVLIAQAVHSQRGLPITTICRKKDDRYCWVMNRISDDAYLDCHGVRSLIEILTGLGLDPGEVDVEAVTPRQIENHRRKYHRSEPTSAALRAAKATATQLIGTYQIGQYTKPSRPPPAYVPIGF